MMRFRKEISDYSSSCEHLIAASLLVDAIPFTVDEIEVIGYYGTEMTSLADQLLRNARPQTEHKRDTIRNFAAACESLLLMNDFSEDERASIRSSVSDIAAKILNSRLVPN